MTQMQETARHLAEYGRFGDDMLVHVSKHELAGIASLAPGGQLSVNPYTGLPEAFFFLPFLSALFGAAAPAAAATTTAATTAAGAGKGAAKGGTALAAKALAPVATGVAAPVATGVAAPGIAGLQAAAPTVLTHTMTTGAPAVAQGALGQAAAAAKLPATMNILPTARPAVSALASPAGQSFAGAGTATIGPATPATNVATKITEGARFAKLNPPVVPGVNYPAVAPTTTAGKGFLSGLGGIRDLLSTKNMMPLLIGSQLLGGLFPGKQPKGEKKKDISREKFSVAQPESMTPSFPTAGYQGGTSPEWNYFPNYHYASGGIVSLADGGPVDPQAQMPQDMQMPLNGVPANAPVGEIPTSNLPASQIGTQPTPANDVVQPSTGDEHELIAQTVAAIQGKVPDGDQIILAFIKEFGEDAFKDLVGRVQSQGAPQQSDGMSDSIPASIGGKQPAALSEGEYVVPADVVSGLGNGSTDAGGQHLDRMVAGTRMARTGSPQQPPAMNAGGLIPGYYQGGLVDLNDGGLLETAGFKKGGPVLHPPNPTTVIEEAPGYWSKFFNPFSTPPGSPETGPTWREVIVPPEGRSTVEPPGLLEFLNPFSPPPGESRRK